MIKVKNENKKTEGEKMNANLYRFKPTAAYLRIIGKPKRRWMVKRNVTGETRKVRFFRAIYYWIVCNLKGNFPPFKNINTNIGG